MEKRVRWLHISYWTGAIIDALAAVQMLVPGLMGMMVKVPNFQPGTEYRFAMGMGAALMVGWTVLLLWADRKPVERKGVLPLTIIVILGMILNQIQGLRAQFLSLSGTLPAFVMQTVLLTLFSVSYFNVIREK